VNFLKFFLANVRNMQHVLYTSCVVKHQSDKCEIILFCQIHDAIASSYVWWMVLLLELYFVSIVPSYMSTVTVLGRLVSKLV
jgi:hypothetical protein